METSLDRESSIGKMSSMSSTTRQRARIISSSSDEDEHESNDLQVNHAEEQTSSSGSEAKDVQPEPVHGIPFRTTGNDNFFRASHLYVVVIFSAFRSRCMYEMQTVVIDDYPGRLSVCLSLCKHG